MRIVAVGILTWIFSAGLAFADISGAYFEAEAISDRQNCEDIWVDLKTYNWPDLELESLRGVVTTRENSSGQRVCVAIKTIYGPRTDVHQVVDYIDEKYKQNFNLKIIDIGKTRFVGHFEEKHTGNFRLDFDAQYTTFSEVADASDWGNWSGDRFADYFRVHFSADSYADEIQIHFDSGNCLQEFHSVYKIFAVDVDGNEIAKIAHKDVTSMAPICE